MKQSNRKAPIKKLTANLSKDQAEIRQSLLDNDISLILGLAGSGKTNLACNVAYQRLTDKITDTIFIARPMVDDRYEKIGILPGDIRDKLIGVTTPIIQNFYNIIGKDVTEKYLQDKVIQVIPLSFLRGMTICDSTIILDEVQNARVSQVYDALSRLGNNTIIIACGDIQQCDLPNRSESGLPFFKELQDNGIPINICNLTSNHRKPIVEQINKYYANRNTNNR